MSETILIVDDRVRLCESLQASLEVRGYKVLIAANGAAALGVFQGGGVDAVLLDVRLGDEDGLQVLARMRALDPRVPVIVITGFGNVESAVTAIKEGAFDYLQKPIQVEKLLKVLENALRLSALERENRELRQQGPRIRTQSPAMRALLERLTLLAGSELPVLIRGESGTGKELVAEHVHAASRRAKAPLEKVNCAAFPESLLDNELFGHEKGAFTGANGTFRGMFERAHGGTLLLDELGDMPPAIQAKILRAIQNKEIRRLGGTSQVTVDIRFIAATNQDLEAQVAAGRFRSDLLYRLNAATVVVPPLRERPEDVVPLAREMLAELAPAGQPKRLAPEAEALLLACPWPGNVRELRSAVQYACTVAASAVIGPADFPENLRAGPPQGSPLGPREAAERSLIVRILRDTGFNKTDAARILQMSRVTLYSKIAKYGIGHEAAHGA
jgi:DNA-binding NtrC family response regulator